MFFSRWFRRRPRPHHTYRPTLCQLEDRVTPTTLLGISGPATHFAVLSTSSVDVARSAAVLVQAEDANNLPAFGYQGTVQFSLGNTDNNASLPKNYTFSFRDHGAHLFQVVLGTAESQSIIVTDTSNSSITGSVNVNVISAPVTSQFLVQMPATVLAGQPVPVTVVAQDGGGHLAWYYTGKVTFGSSDGKAVLPASYQFTAQDHGTHTFMVTFNSSGSQSVKVSDTVTSSIAGSGQTMVNAAPAAAGFMVVGNSSPTAGVPTSATIVAVDGNGRPVSNYSGTVRFTSSDTKATLPPITLITGGRVRVPVTFNSTGSQTLTATATTGSPPINGQETLTVAPVPAVNQLEAFALGSASVGTPTAVLIVALGGNGLPVPGYNGTLHLTSSDKGASLPANYTFSPGSLGRHVFLLTFNTPGTQTLTVADTVNSALTITINVVVS